MFAGIIITYNLWFVQSLVPISFRWICIFLSYCLRCKKKQSLRCCSGSYLGLFFGPISFPLHTGFQHTSRNCHSPNLSTLLYLSTTRYTMGSFSAPAPSLLIHVTFSRTRSSSDLIQVSVSFDIVAIICSSVSPPFYCIIMGSSADLHHIFHASINWRGCFRTCCSN